MAVAGKTGSYKEAKVLGPGVRRDDGGKQKGLKSGGNRSDEPHARRGRSQRNQ